MIRSLRAVFVLALAAGIAAAQDPDPVPSDQGIPTRREKDRVKMAPRGGAESGKPGKDGAAKPDQPPPPPADPFTANIQNLAGWPEPAAREAAAALALLGPDIEGKLLDLLPAAGPPLAAGIAAVLGDIGGDESLAAVQRLAGVPAMSPYLPLLFDVLSRLDGENAVKRVLPFVRHPKRPAREAAETWLSGRLNASYLPRLEELVEDPSRGARLSGLRLLRRVDAARGVVKAFEHLGDEAPEVARLSAEILTAHADAEVIKGLNEIVGGADARRAAYAGIALVFVEERTGNRPWTQASIDRLLGLNGVRSAEKLNRGVAAIALADIGFDSEMPAVDAVLDQTVVPVLLDTFAGPTMYKDYTSIADIARDRFGKLTGRFERVPGSELWDWWLKNKDGFSARRALREIGKDQLDTLRVRARSLADPPLPTTLFSCVAGDAGGPDVSGIDFVYLLPGDADALAAVLSRYFLPLKGIAAVKESGEGENAGGGELGPDVQVTLSVGGRSRTVTAWAAAVPSELARVLTVLRELRERYVWQRFWDRGAYPDYAAFIKAESGFFASAPEAEARAAKMKDLILASLDDLVTPAERLDAVRILGDLPVTFTDRDAYRLSLILEAERDLTPFADRAATILAGTGRSLVMPILTNFLEQHPGGRGLDILSGALVKLGTDEVLRAVASDRVFLRRAATRAAPGSIPPSGLAPFLAKVAADRDPLVRREAYLALGASGLSEALPLLDAGCGDQDADAAAAAVRGLGQLGRPEAIPLLLRQLSSDDTARRVTAVEALCATGLPEALPPVLNALAGDASPLVRGVAARDAVKFGEAAVRGLSAMAMDPARDALVRALALEAMASIGRDLVSDVLVALLEDPMPEVADAAAFALAARGRKAAVPRLLEAIEAGRNPARTVAALEQVSLQAFPSARPEELPPIYRGWWAEHKTDSESAWLAAALRERGATEDEVKALAAGGPDASVVPALLRGLADAAWFLRANCNLALQRLTLKDCGEITRFTSAEETRAVEARWRALLEGR